MTRIKKLGWWLLLCAVLPLPMTAAAEPFQAGRDYVELPQALPVETGSKIELREFFWYGCPHCYHFEPALTSYVAKLPANVQFVRMPATLPRWLVHAQTFYAFEALGVTAKLHQAFFEALHAKKRELNDEASIAAFVAEQGVDQVKFKDKFSSFEVHMRLERAKQANQGFNIDGVPMLAIDGRYLVSPEAGASGRYEGTLRVVDFLVQKAAKERSKKPLKG